MTHTTKADYSQALDAIEKFADIVAAMRDEYLSETQNYPWIVGFSGGKDSTLVAHAVFDALLSVAPSKRTRHVHIVSNDTLVESPLVMAHLHATQSVIETAAQNLRLPVTVVTTQPDLEQSFCRKSALTPIILTPIIWHNRFCASPSILCVHFVVVECSHALFK